MSVSHKRNLESPLYIFLQNPNQRNIFHEGRTWYHHTEFPSPVPF